MDQGKRWRGPESSELMDCSYAVGEEDVTWSRPIIKGWVEGCPVQATLDLGCTQSLVRANLVQPQGRRKAIPVKVACLHGEAKQIERLWIRLRVMEHQGEFLVGIVPQLAFKMLLGRDWAPFYDVLDRVQDAEVAHKKIQNDEGWLGEVEENEESTDEAEGLDLNDSTSCLQFREAQEENLELRTLQEQVRDTRDVPIPPPDGIPHFEVRNQLLY
ncbi:hypothetical protein Y1Q_0023200 [Alligator mississippiensis]|uniref:Uncharacterized protein n=1 Tax=Alligator mississippiensis TaxID=8496 RepID=A0A151MZC8_ALLMI|nr:hypothetical protein Y1Q_0023200 [Alligator mississippiensis]